MAYKDKEKQRDAVKKAVQRHRQGITEQGITTDAMPKDVIPDNVIPEMSQEELRDALQWGIDTRKIRTSPEVAEAIGLTPRYGPQHLDRWQLLALVNRYCYQQGIYPASTYLGAHDGPEYGVSIIPDGTPAYLPIPKGLREELPKSRVVERGGFLALN